MRRVQKAGWYDPLKQEVIMYGIKFHCAELDTIERSGVAGKLLELAATP